MNILSEHRSTKSRSGRYGASPRLRNAVESLPKIETAAYIFDRVKHIEVKEEIPENLVTIAKSESWAQMARTQAFQQLFQELGPHMNFKVECVIREKEEVDASGRNRHFVICHLRYTTE